MLDHLEVQVKPFRLQGVCVVGTCLVLFLYDLSPILDVLITCYLNNIMSEPLLSSFLLLVWFGIPCRDCT